MFEVGDEPEPVGKCPFQDKTTGRVCGFPLIYDGKYDVYKCGVHNHYMIDREEFERRKRLNSP